MHSENSAVILLSTTVHYYKHYYRLMMNTNIKAILKKEEGVWNIMANKTDPDWQEVYTNTFMSIRDKIFRI